MKKSLLSAVALTAMVAFSGNAWADIIVGVAGPLTGPNAAFGAQLLGARRSDHALNFRAARRRCGGGGHRFSQSSASRGHAQG